MSDDLEVFDPRTEEDEREWNRTNPSTKPVRRRLVGPPATRGGVYEKLAFGTGISPNWSLEWLERVTECEAMMKRPICGARRSRKAVRALTDDERESTPFYDVCKQAAGQQTTHLGDGRCVYHGGNSPARSMKGSLVKNQNLAWRVDAFMEDADLVDTKHAIATAWAAIDTAYDDEDITTDQALDLVSAMAKIGTLNKQHNDILAAKKITIDIHEFMAWAEHFYEIAIRHIERKDGDVAGFIGDAESFFTGTVTQVTGVRNSAFRAGSVVEVDSVAHTGVEDTGGTESETGPDLLRGEVRQATRPTVDNGDQAVPEGHGDALPQGFKIRPLDTPRLPTTGGREGSLPDGVQNSMDSD